ncbi:MAG: UvrD-helicase domain-containing protein [Bacteroidales bacterium]|nr:UvrD-helicase domain-containing protein [Bacteroidales bacterium]
MRFIADFHIHSHFSLATSKQLTPEHLDFWAKLKGISVVGTGDFTHPGWLEELQKKLEPAEEGLYKLKKEYILPFPHSEASPTRFVLTSEISNIYTKGGRVRKVHNLVFAPCFDVASGIQARLEQMKFNIRSDGRPILGLDSRDLLEICLNVSEDIFFVPAHIWTPWFSALGSKSGFDSIEECYGDLTSHISAVETGLSTDPPMNRICSFLDGFTLIANSDAHSPEKLGRNANILNTNMSYPEIISAIRSNDPALFPGTIDFFPQEGKYHYDGHRRCNLRWDPLESLRHDEICPVCGKKVVVGVMSRIAGLADRDEAPAFEGKPGFFSLIPLKEMLSEIHGSPSASNKIHKQYLQILQKAGPELDMLLDMSLDRIATLAGETTAEAVRRMRNREVVISEGYDGEYGRIRVFAEDELKNPAGQASLFSSGLPSGPGREKIQPRPLLSFDLKKFRELKGRKSLQTPPPAQPDLFSMPPVIASTENEDQQAAIRHFNGPAMVLAGPGTGKTRVLTKRIEFLVKQKGVSPGSILAVTFTNKAAAEIGQRLQKTLSGAPVNVSTFHAWGYTFLKKYHKTAAGFHIADEEDQAEILINTGLTKQKVHRIIRDISSAKQKMQEPDADDPSLKEAWMAYEKEKSTAGIFDYDDLLLAPIRIMLDDPEVLGETRDQNQWLLVDEYQDVNPLQYALIRLLMPARSSNLFVIGDPNQAIYGFRGSDVAFIQKFRDDYPDAAVYGLSQSYRCPGIFLNASASVLPEGMEEFPLKGRLEGVKIRIIGNSAEKSEAEYIAREIERKMGGTDFFSMYSRVAEGDENVSGSLSEFAILCRTSAQMPAIEKALKDHHIPFQKAGEEPFFRKGMMKQVLRFFRVAAGESIPVPGDPLSEKVRLFGEPGEIYRKGAGGRDNLAGIVDRYFSEERKKNPDDFEKLLLFAEDFGKDEEAFIRNVSLGRGIDEWKAGLEAVSLLTLHASKGLEFETVFIAGCEEKLIPFSLFPGLETDEDEERRLLYVGMTRAGKNLFMTYATKRFIAGREVVTGKSPFLDAIRKEYLDAEMVQYRKKPDPYKGQTKLFE